MPRTPRDLLAAIRASDDHHLYASLAPLYAFVYDRHFDYDDQFAVVREHVPADAASILEGGCGTGRLLARLEDAYDRVVGVDLHPEMAAIARERVARADVVVTDLRTVCFSAPFDAVVMLGRVFPHVRTDEAAIELLANCRSLLAPGGAVVFDTFDARGLEDGHVTEDTFESEAYTVERTLTGFVTDRDAGRWGFDAEYAVTDRTTGERAVAEETMHLRAHSPADLESYLAAAGFEDATFVRESDFSARAAARTPPG